MASLLLWFQWGCMFLSCIVSLIYLRQLQQTPFMKNFFLYPIVAVISIFIRLMHRSAIISGSSALLITNLLLIFHYYFLGNFIFNVMAFKKKLSILQFIFFINLVAIIFFLFRNGIFVIQPIPFALSNFGLVIFCIYYYYTLFTNYPSSNLIKEPAFWIVTGIFFCMCATIPELTLYSFLQNHLSNDSFKVINSLICFSYGVMHLFFFKATFFPPEPKHRANFIK